MKLSPIAFVAAAVIVVASAAGSLWTLRSAPAHPTGGQQAEKDVSQTLAARSQKPGWRGIPVERAQPKAGRPATGETTISESDTPKQPAAATVLPQSLALVREGMRAAVNQLPNPQAAAQTVGQPAGNQASSSAPPSLAERAMKVENEANRELERLVPLLNLSEDQQDRVFAKLAQNSVYWNSGLSATGTPKAASTSPSIDGANTPVTSTPVKSIPDLLTTSDGGEPILSPDQEKTIVQDDLDRREWWGEVLGIIQTNIAAGTTTATSAGAAASAVPAVTQPVKGSGTVVD